MARGRMLNKSVSASQKFHLLPDDTCRLLATWTIAQLDKNGVFYGDPVIVKSLVFPRRADITVEQIDWYLTELEQAGLIILFNSQGQIWQYWPGFADNQTNLRTDRETTDFPAPIVDQLMAQTPATPEVSPEKSDGIMPEEIRQEAGSVPALCQPNLKESNLKENKLTTTAGNGRGFSDDDLHEVSTAYEANIGFISPMAAEQLKDLLGTYSKDWILEGFRIAVKANKRRLNYVEGILRKWETGGKDGPSPNGNGPPGAIEDKPKYVAYDKKTGERIL